MEVLNTVVGVVLGAVLTLAVGLWRDWLRARRARREAADLDARRAFKLQPVAGSDWWLIRSRGPAVTITHAMRLTPRNVGGTAETTGGLLPGSHIEVGTPYGLGTELLPGDYWEVHWTEDDTGAALSNGVRITDPNAVHWIEDGQNGH